MNTLSSSIKFLLDIRRKKYASGKIFDPQSDLYKDIVISDEDYAKMVERSDVYSSLYLYKDISKNSCLYVKDVVEANDMNWIFLTDENLTFKVQSSEACIKYLFQNDVEKFREFLKENKVYITVKNLHNKIATLNDFYYDYLTNEFKEQINNPNKIFEAYVVDKNSGGYLCNVNGIICFLPGSAASPNKLLDFQKLLGKRIKVMIDGYMNGKFIISYKKFIEFTWADMIKKLDYKAVYTGTTTGSIANGLFVEWDNYYTGMLKIEDMDDELMNLFIYKYDNKYLFINMELKFRIKEIDKNNKIFLTTLPDELVTLETDYHSLLSKIGMEVTGTVITKGKVNRETGISRYFIIFKYNDKNYIGSVLRPDGTYVRGSKDVFKIKNVSLDSKMVMLF